MKKTRSRKSRDTVPLRTKTSLFYEFILICECCRIRRRERREQIRQILAEHWALKQTQVKHYWHCQRYKSYHTEKSARSLLVNYWVLAALHTRAQRAPICLGSLTHVTGRCGPPPPAHRSFAASLSFPLK